LRERFVASNLGELAISTLVPSGTLNTASRRFDGGWPTIFGLTCRSGIQQKCSQFGFLLAVEQQRIAEANRLPRRVHFFMVDDGLLEAHTIRCQGLGKLDRVDRHSNIGGFVV
jgi:hypothetical protein